MTDRETAELLKKAVAALEERANAQPCEDAISRVDALNAVTMASVRSEAIENIELIPNTYQRPTGKKAGRWEWVQYDANPEIGNFHCSECRYIPASFNMSAQKLNFCPNCGAKMEGVKE